MRRSPLWLAFVALIVLAATGRGHGADETVEHLIPSEFCGEYVFLELVFESTPDQRLRMLVDSGASHTMVDPDSIERISGDRVKVGKRARFSNLHAGALRFNTLRARVRELDHIAHALGDDEFDGILGYGAFKQVLLTIDYADREVRIAEGSLPKPDDVEVFTYRGKARPFLRTRVNGRRVDLLIDTGSNDSISIHEKHELDWVAPPIHLASAVRLDRIEQRFAGRLAGDVEFGPVTFEQPIVEQTDGTELVGTEILRHFEITFDQRHRRVRLVPVADESRVRLAGRRSTGVVTGLHPRGREVTRVVEESPASELGIQVGDVITSINGLDVIHEGCLLRNVQLLELDQYNYVLERKGQRVELVVPIVELVP